MSEKRKDNKGRVLHQGEMQLKDGRYRFKYVDPEGVERYVYSWRLNHSDATPMGKPWTLSLREFEKQIQADLFDHIAPNGGNLTFLGLVEPESGRPPGKDMKLSLISLKKIRWAKRGSTLFVYRTQNAG